MPLEIQSEISTRKNFVRVREILERKFVLNIFFVSMFFKLTITKLDYLSNFLLHLPFKSNTQTGHYG